MFDGMEQTFDRISASKPVCVSQFSTWERVQERQPGQECSEGVGSEI